MDDRVSTTDGVTTTNPFWTFPRVLDDWNSPEDAVWDE